VKRDSFYADLPDFIAIQVTGTDHVRVRKVMSEALAETKANITEWIEHGVPTDKE
jgi:predicted amino acid-binding ACT domain protein